INTRPVYSYDARGGKFASGKGWSAKELSGRAFFSPLTNPPSLVLNPSHPDDQGRYTCRIDYRLSPSTTTYVNLTIAIPPGTPIMVSGGVVVVGGGTIGPVRQGEEVEVWCKSKGGRPSPLVTWWRGGTRLPNQATSITTNINSGVNTVESKVVLRATRELLGARFTCHAHTPTPRQHTHSHLSLLHPRTTSFTLDITLPPLEVNIVGLNTDGVSAGTTLRLLCSTVGSHPPAQLVWWRGHTRLTPVKQAMKDDEGNVTISTVTMVARRELDGVTLVCSATNILLRDAPLTRSVRLKVFYSPMVRLSLGRPLHPSHIKEGDDVFFECNIQANPQPHRIFWYHNGSGVKHNPDEGVVVSGLSLAVRGVYRQHTGTYTCTATNTQGTNTSNPVHLLVQYAPVCVGGVTGRTQLAIQGQETVVWCQVEAHPSQNITWHWERELLDGTVMSVPEGKVNKKGLISSIAVTPISPGDYGDLVCHAANSVERQRDSCVVTLVPSVPPQPPSNCSVTHITTTTTTPALITSTTTTTTTTPAVIIPTTSALTTTGTSTTPALTVVCLEGFDGGLPQRFLLEAWQDGERIVNLTSEFPEWVLEGMVGGEGTRVSVTAFNARGSSVPLFLQVPQASARHHAPQESEDNGVGMSTLLGAAVGVGAVLLLLVVVGAVVAQHTHQHPHSHTKISHHHKVPGGGGEGEIELMWDNYNSDADQDIPSPPYTPHHHHHHPPSLASVEYTHTQSLVDVHTQTLTPILTPSHVHSTPMIHLNGKIVSGSSPTSQVVESDCQVGDCCSDVSCESEAESVIEVIKLSPATRAKFMSKGYTAPEYVSVSTKEPWRGQHVGVLYQPSPPPMTTTMITNQALQPLHSHTNTSLPLPHPHTHRNYRDSPRTFRNKRRKLPRIHKGKVIRYTDNEGQEPQYGPSQLLADSPSETYGKNGNEKNAGGMMMMYGQETYGKNGNEKNVGGGMMMMYGQETAPPVPPPKPPRAFSHSSLTGNALLSPLSSTSCPSGFNLDTPVDSYSSGAFTNEATTTTITTRNNNNKAPLAEDEVRDAYSNTTTSIRPKPCQQFKSGVIESAM
ncbi:hypothetical protein Pcinc_030762, partial [Petrolisthes cinctipes]